MAQVTVDDELVEGLKQAKKSPRNFALIAKGAAPLKLLVQKKRFRDGDLMKAKTEAKGNLVITGVLLASGADFAFQVVGEEPAIKPIKLKELIAEQAGMPVKPRFEVVTELPEVSEADDESEKGDAAPGEQPSVPDPTAPSGREPSSPAPAGSVAYAKLLLAFEGAKKKLHADLQNLERAILGEFAGDPALADVQRNVRKLDEIVASFDDSLKDLFDDAVSQPVDQRGELHRQALAVIGNYQTYLSSDPFVRDVADNPFDVPVSVKLMNDTLSVLAKNLA